MKKRVLSILLAINFILMLAPKTFALSGSENNVIMSNSRITLYLDSTIDDIQRVYGSEKLKTKSKFGGHAYSFYDGDDYSDYLFIETTSSGKIAMFSVFGDDFTSFASSSGAPASNVGYSGTLVYEDDDTGNVWAVAALCSDNFSQAERTLAAENSSEAHYAEAIAQHSAIMWNAICVYYGYPATAEFDRKTFYINRQLMENDSDFINYLRGLGSSAHYMITKLYLEHALLTSVGIMLSPLTYANYAKYYDLPSNSYVVFDTYNSVHIVGAINKSYYLDRIDIPYTQEESALIEKMRTMFAESTSNWNDAFDNYYLEEPQYKELPLVAGRVNPDSIKAAIQYLNVIRIGAGLSELSYSKEISEAAQCKAVLTQYCSSNGIRNPDPHEPPQPEGVSDEFYAKAQMYMGGEVLYWGDAVSSITHALHDSEGDPITCGHRYSLLNPNSVNIGLGNCNWQGTHKLSGYRDADVDVVAWPSKGIMISEVGAGSEEMYTIAFYRHYTTDDSEIIFKCLNTGETFTFDSETENTDSHQFYNLFDMLSYYDDSIALQAGNVYEITATNLEDSETGEIVDYTYRCVYENMDDETAGGATGLTLSASSLSLGIGETGKLNATIQPADATNKMVTWSSSKSDVVSVNENGYVTANGIGSATITAKTDNGIIASCLITVLSTPIFADVSQSDWFYDGVSYVTEKGLMQGVGGNKFNPSGTTSRGMIVTILYRLEGEPTVSQPTFTDVAAGQWFTDAMAWAAANKIVEGYGTNTFGPNDNITREQITMILYRYAVYKSYDVSGLADLSSYTDAGAISSWALTAMRWAYSEGLITGRTTTTLVPNGTTTRAEAATILMRFCQNVAGLR